MLVRCVCVPLIRVYHSKYHLQRWRNKQQIFFGYTRVMVIALHRRVVQHCFKIHVSPHRKGVYVSEKKNFTLHITGSQFALIMCVYTFAIIGTRRQAEKVLSPLFDLHVLSLTIPQTFSSSIIFLRRTANAVHDYYHKTHTKKNIVRRYIICAQIEIHECKWKKEKKNCISTFKKSISCTYLRCNYNFKFFEFVVSHSRSKSALLRI